MAVIHGWFKVLGLLVAAFVVRGKSWGCGRSRVGWSVYCLGGGGGRKRERGFRLRMWWFDIKNCGKIPLISSLF